MISGVLALQPQEIAGDFAKVNVKTNILNESAEEIDVLLVTRVLKNDGTEVAVKESRQKISGKSGTEFNQNLDITSPLLWSVESPWLYSFINEVYIINGDNRSGMTDRTENNFCIRSISVSTENGFLLNGKPLLLKGGFMQPVRKTYQGRCLVIIRAENRTGEIKLKAESDGIQSSEIKIMASNNQI